MVLTTSRIFSGIILFNLMTMPFYVRGEVLIEHLPPPGFTAIDEDSSKSLLGLVNGKYLPAPLHYSSQSKEISFDKELFSNNGINSETISLLDKLLPQIAYNECKSGCDYLLSGYRVTLDKVNNRLIIKDSSLDYLMPSTTWGIVHNQSLNLRVADNHYRAISANGQGYIGLPFQSFGYLSWFYNKTAHVQQRWHQGEANKGIGQSWYLQKNFSSLYLRAGRKNHLDNGAARVQTLLSPGLDRFVTFGSQSYMAEKPTSAGTLTLYATQPGDFDIYRDEQFIRRFPAQLGRNEISYNQLPSGYYNADIRLIDRSGREISRESMPIANISFGGNTGWFATFGQSRPTKFKEKNPPTAYLLQLGRSFLTPWFNSNLSMLMDNDKRWAAEGNISRPMSLWSMDIAPTLGLMSGDQGLGGYLRLSGGNKTLGRWSISRYQTPNVSRYTSMGSSSAFSYGRHFGPTALSYNFNQSANRSQHRLQSDWHWQRPQYRINFSIGAKKDWRNNRANDYGLFFNARLMLQQHNIRLTSIYANEQLTSGIDYQHSRQNDGGGSGLSLNSTLSGKNHSMSSTVSRQGSQGNLSIDVGANNHTMFGGLRYSGMLAANTQGIALGPAGFGGGAMLVTTPEIGVPYSFRVQGQPVIGGGTTAIPVPLYNYQSFADIQTSRSDMDMRINLPVNMIHAHPGQVFSAKADIQLTLLYNGFFRTQENQPVSGNIVETGDEVHPNGLFSISSGKVLKYINVKNDTGSFLCDLSQQRNHYYLCHPN
ncbi:TcfC E-set like domain-containing protein [Yersinia nurmii]|uniref:TcfC E-set like domain-containing protein n=1 Tax=Yersinia nurmii TaxID=685706 RepID=A0AAW7K732_9GAMM|nr:TcfC E-set like domain-containing protein [Yersinia nurmii]MDN0089365.1 TcfC E-set like domain-containing protein [Yersinia nurmii]